MENSKKKILIVASVQFGYNTDWYNYSELLSQKYDVTYLCFDCNQEKVQSEKVNIIYLDWNYYTYRLNLLKSLKELSKNNTYHKVFVYVFPGCSLLRWFFKKEKLILDIRTSYITSPIKTWLNNRLVRFESSFYDKISVISWGVADFLGLQRNKCRLLPLGSKALPFCKKDMSRLSLLYVGTFFDRHIEKTIEGFRLFKEKYPNAEVSYDIVGSGSREDIAIVEKSILDHNVSDCVNYLGEKRGDDLLQINKEHNVGISYIPLTPYYDCQPPTKTFEYLLNSMIVLATPTAENAKVISDVNGRLCKGDSAEDFAEALQYIYENRNSYSLMEIYAASQIYTWENIADKFLFSFCE